MKANSINRTSRTTLRWMSRLGLVLLVWVLVVVLLPGTETATGRGLEPLRVADRDPAVVPRELQLTPGPEFSINQQGVGWVFIVVSSTEPAGVEHIGSTAGYNNLFGLASPVDMDLFYCKDTAPGFTVDLGAFPAGTELIFRLTTPQGDTFYNGPPERNPDNMTHASISQLGPQRWYLGWEDILGGGDQDYNDCEMVVTGAVAGMSEPPPTPTATPTVTPTPTSTPTPTPTFTPTPAPVLEAEKTSSLLVDADASGGASPGDTLLYDVTIGNSGNGAATGVFYTDAIDSNTTLVANSVQTTQGTVTSGNAPGDTTVGVDIDTIPGGGGSVTISFQVTINNPLPAGVSEIVNQGTVSSNELPDVPTDDPGTVASDDPTVTPITATPVLEAEKTSSLLVDADASGGASPGDTLLYEVTIVNSGNIAVTGVFYTDAIDSNTTLVASSVQTTQGTVTSGNVPGDTTIGVDIGTIPGGGGSVTISFQVTINNPLPAGVSQIVNQGTVSSNELPDVLTDDPGTVADDDPTVTPITATPVLEAEKTSTLLIDADDSGAASPGDTLLYEVTIINSGNIAVSGVVYTDTIDSKTTLVANSVQTTQGTVISGNDPSDTTVEVDIGTIRGGGGSVTIGFQVTINNIALGGVMEVVNQGLVLSNELPDVPTDDPNTVEDDDPTVTPVIPGEMTPGICWQLEGRIPQEVVDHAIAHPEMYFGWGQCVNPNAPCPSPANPYRHWLSLLNINARYHPLFNPPIWQPSCPK